MQYEFRTASGSICCSSDNPDHLCAHCKAANAKLAENPYRAAMDAAPPPVEMLLDESGVPDSYASALARRTR